MGKFEHFNWSCMSHLPEGAHGVNVFSTPEMKGRRRLITEPHLNGVIRKGELPRLKYPTRLEKRQGLRKARYMLQLDFEAFYDAIPLPEETRHKFVFRTKSGGYYRLKTLPTGARWSVVVGQGITNMIVDIATEATIYTCIDNILIAARNGMENTFCATVRSILRRIEAANLLTSPDRNDLLRRSDSELLSLAEQDQTFLGEEYSWNGGERKVRNSIKTVAKLHLALQARSFTCRSFVSLVSLELYALHTTRLNPASCFHLLRAYRGIYRLVSRGKDWDETIPYLDARVRLTLLSLGERLVLNQWWQIAPHAVESYEDAVYDLNSFTDASVEGWGAIVRTREGQARAYQQRWETDLGLQTPETNNADAVAYFKAKHSAHAEPRAISTLLKILQSKRPGNNQRWAIVTDHIAIVRAQRRSNGYGGIGRGYMLNKFFQFTNHLFHHCNIQVTFFYLAGASNPADTLSRNFGVDTSSQVAESDANNIGVPKLSHTFSPLCE